MLLQQAKVYKRNGLQLMNAPGQSAWLSGGQPLPVSLEWERVGAPEQNLWRTVLPARRDSGGRSGRLDGHANISRRSSVDKARASSTNL